MAHLQALKIREIVHTTGEVDVEAQGWETATTTVSTCWDSMSVVSSRNAP